jgi:hypothetical protein
VPLQINSIADQLIADQLDCVLSACRFPQESTNIDNHTLSLMRATAVARERNGEQAKLSLLNVQYGLESLSAWLEGSSLKPSSQAVSKEVTLVREKWRQAITKVVVPPSFPFYSLLLPVHIPSTSLFLLVCVMDKCMHACHVRTLTVSSDNLTDYLLSTSPRSLSKTFIVQHMHHHAGAATLES